MLLLIIAVILVIIMFVFILAEEDFFDIIPFILIPFCLISVISISYSIYIDKISSPQEYLSKTVEINTFKIENQQYLYSYFDKNGDVNYDKKLYKKCKIKESDNVDTPKFETYTITRKRDSLFCKLMYLDYYFNDDDNEFKYVFVFPKNYLKENKIEINY